MAACISAPLSFFLYSELIPSRRDGPKYLPWSSSFPIIKVSANNLFPSTSNIARNQEMQMKSLVIHVIFSSPRFSCLKLDVGRYSVRAVTIEVDSKYKGDAATPNLMKTDALTSTFKDSVISAKESSSFRKTSRKEKNPKMLSSSAAQTKTLDHFAVLRYPLRTESAMKAMMEYNTLVFVVDKHCDKNNIKDAVQTIFKVKAMKVNTLIMPNGNKKAYIMLAPEFKAMDLAKNIKIL
ncbi:60S ribosomal protein L23A [Orobanche hederae]